MKSRIRVRTAPTRARVRKRKPLSLSLLGKIRQQQRKSKVNANIPRKPKPFRLVVRTLAPFLRHRSDDVSSRERDSSSVSSSATRLTSSTRGGAVYSSSSWKCDQRRLRAQSKHDCNFLYLINLSLSRLYDKNVVSRSLLLLFVRVCVCVCV